VILDRLARKEWEPFVDSDGIAARVFTDASPS